MQPWPLLDWGEKVAPVSRAIRRAGIFVSPLFPSEGGAGRREHSRENESVTVQPIGVLGVEPQELVPENVGNGSHAPAISSLAARTGGSGGSGASRHEAWPDSHGGTGMSRVALEGRINLESQSKSVNALRPCSVLLVCPFFVLFSSVFFLWPPRKPPLPSGVTKTFQPKALTQWRGNGGVKKQGGKNIPRAGGWC